MKNATTFFTDNFEQVSINGGQSPLNGIRREAFNTFSKLGIPAARHEEWKYTRVAGLFNKEYDLPAKETSIALDAYRLPGHEMANELFFINGKFSFKDSIIRSKELIVLPLEEAAEGEYKETVNKYLGHSTRYLKDGINALNLAYMQGAVFIHVDEGDLVEHPVYIYNICDARSQNILAQPRSLVYVGQNAQLILVETFITEGKQESFTNQVMEIVVDTDATMNHYKIQNDASHANQLSTTHIRQIGKSYTYSVTISLNGNIVRNNTNVVLEAEHCEAHLYGLYFEHGDSHIDNHTVVDNVKPHCYSNELYKGIMAGNSTGVFNGKIFVRPQAQKTNAYQSNKNILLSDAASVNTKPQLEIFADDVKCSHGCTIGQLDEEGLFYLQSRGIPEKIAKSMLLHGFVIDILEKIRLEPIRNYVDQLISERLELI